MDKVVKKEEKPQKQVISTPKKTVAAIADPVTVVEPPLEPENTVVSQPDIAPVSPIAEEREKEPTADLSPLLQKLAILVTNIRAIITEDPTLSSGISLVG